MVGHNVHGVVVVHVVAAFSYVLDVNTGNSFN